MLDMMSHVAFYRNIEILQHECNKFQINKGLRIAILEVNAFLNERINICI